MATLKLYSTSLEPDLDQAIYSQSIGGYVSNSLLYPETTLTETIGLYGVDITLATPSSGNWTEWQGIEYINIGNELIKVPSFVNGSVVASQRAYNGIYNMHIAGDIVKAVSAKEIFNDVFNDEYKQYRCLAIKNVSTNTTDPSQEKVAYDIEVYFKQNSRNINSSIKLSLEKPKSEYISGTSTGWSTMTVVDSSLAYGSYEDDYFKEAYLKITSGAASGQEGKVISSFDRSSGTFTFYNSFFTALDFTGTVTYEVHPSPAQRVKTGTTSPVVGNSNVTNFLVPDDNNSLRFFEQPSVFNISNLHFNDVMYIWVERTVEKGSSEFLHNDFVLNYRYKVSV